jgi:hypothetical protein
MRERRRSRVPAHRPCRPKRAVGCCCRPCPKGSQRRTRQWAYLVAVTPAAAGTFSLTVCGIDGRGDLMDVDVTTGPYTGYHNAGSPQGNITVMQQARVSP